MNKAKLKSYAPQARKDFIAAVVARANQLGISEKNGMLEIATSEKKGDVTLIAGQAWPAKVHEQRERLIKRIQKTGVGETAEAIAYTWFNRFAALRYMEIHDYLGHGHRVISSRDGGLPEILTHATELTEILYGLNATQVADMKLAGNRDGELYRMLLVAQCNALSSTMPFLFERIDDETELLLPDNLLRTDSIVAKLVAGVPEEDWADVEIIGWLYQFYIIDEKARIDAKLKKGEVVLSPEIPAKTQLFTPNWIVQYLVQNSVGRLWLMANPQSTLAKEWPYYITPAEQTPEVQAQLDALIQTRVREDGDTLNPESITVLDPACGSGHIVVVAYDVLKAIYLERGYRVRDIPRLILEKNLYGLDIDDRAAQMAGFALLMKARADDRRLFTATDEAGNLPPCNLNVLSLQESKGLDAGVLNVGFEPGRYATFPADADGIVPITDELWFADDAPSRIREFLRAVWGPDTLEENMSWLAESLGTNATETPDETIRRYIADKFFKDHLQTYKKRPIYWLFSCGKQGAFQALVYLHRYHEGTLARLRSEYVVPLTGKMQSRIEMLEKDKDAASSTAARNKIAKQIESLKKKHVELLAYDEKLRHYADMRITLDLDDGVKVNYGKFGDLLAEVKAVTGGTGDE